MMERDAETTLLNTAISQITDFIQGIRNNQEELEYLPSSLNKNTDSLLFVKQEKEEVSAEPVWHFGISGHGIQSLRLYCHWASRRLDAAVCLPYERVFSTEESQQEYRNSILGACMLMLRLLMGERDGISYVLNNQEARLNAVWDRDGLRYRIEHEETIIREGSDWDELERYLDENEVTVLRTGDNGMMIFMP